MERILVGVDGSEPSKDALRWAADQARRTGSELQVVFGWDHNTSHSLVSPVPTLANLEETQRRGLQDLVREVLGNDPGVNLTLTVVEAHPSSALLGLAKGAELLVVGCRGHGAFAGMLLGSVSLHCATNAACPVVVVHRHPSDE